MWKTRDKDFILLREQQVKDVANLNTHTHTHTPTPQMEQW